MVITLRKIDNVWSKIEAEPHIIQELSEKFTFKVPGYQFMPAYRAKRWDGNIRLLKRGTNKIYAGLTHYIQKYAEENNYQLNVDYSHTQELKPLSFSKWFYNGEQIHPHDHQSKAIYAALKNKRQLFLSPTASGKSLVIYTIARNLLSQIPGKVLILVPTTSLVEQMYSDFSHYADADWDSTQYCTRIYSGMIREDKAIVISTWQSLYDKPALYFSNFNAVIGDEAHLFKSKEISGLLEKLSQCEYRYGFTGSQIGRAHV